METRPMGFINHGAANPALQAKIREKITKNRLPKDIKELFENKEYQTVLAQKDNMGRIWIKLKIPGGYYRNQTHILEIKTSTDNGTFDYPFTAPLVKFLTPMFHVNISYVGSICLSILKGKDHENPLGWTEAYNLNSVLVAIIALLDQPGTESPWNKEAAMAWVASDEGADEAKFMQAADKYYLAGNYKSAIEAFDARYAEDNS